MQRLAGLLLIGDGGQGRHDRRRLQAAAAHPAVERRLAELRLTGAVLRLAGPLADCRHRLLEPRLAPVGALMRAVITSGAPRRAMVAAGGDRRRIADPGKWTA